MSEYPETTVLALIVVGLLVYVWRKKLDFFSPATVYIFFQCLTLGIAYLQLDHAMTPFHSKTWFVWIGAMLSFVSGCLLYQWNLKKRELAVSTEKGSSYNWKVHFIFSCIILLVYLFGVYGIYKVVGSLILFSKDPSHWTSSEINYGVYSQFFSSAPLVVMLFGVSMFKSMNPVRGIRWASRVIVPLICALCICAYPSRTTLFMCVGFTVILFNYLCKKIPVLFIATMLAIGISAFVFVASARSQYMGNNSIKSMTMDAALMMPYRYVANNYWNLDYVLNPNPDRKEHPITYGVDFFTGIFEYSGMPGAIRKSMGWDGLFNESVQKIPGYNTTGYLWEVYKDFGLPGCFWFPFLAGLGLSVLYVRMQQRKTPRRVMFYVFFIYFVGFWFFLAGYKQGIFWAWGVILYAITAISSWNKKVLL